MNTPPIPAMAAALDEQGLILRGWFSFGEEEIAPPGPHGAPARSAILVGNAGSALWSHFLAWRRRQPRHHDDPLDAWSREVIEAVAERFGARAVFPFTRPYLPFQQWAMRAEGLKASPLGMLMHPEFGLWHAYRGALLLDHEISGDPHRGNSHPCAACVAKPCLSACRVAAFSQAGFDYEACLRHVLSDAGVACSGNGCLARHACPVGVAFRYEAEQQHFHMAAFARQ